MDEVKKIEHYKNLNTDTSENSAADLDSFLKKNKKNKEMSEIVAGSIPYVWEKEWANEVY